MFSVMPKAILFDNDGVLVASEPLHWDAWGKLLTVMGIQYRAEELSQLAGRTAPEILRLLLDRYRPGWKERDYDFDKLALQKNDFYLEGLESRLKSYPGVPEGLKWLKSIGVKTAVVSNAKRRELMRAITATGIADDLDIHLSRDDTGVPKPDPKPYLMAAEKLGVAPADCIVVEDSPTGLRAGLMAKMPSVAILSTFTRSELKAPVPGRPELKPVLIAATMAEFFEELRRVQTS